MTAGTEIVAIVGAGTTGTGIAQVIADAGHDFILCDQDAVTLEHAARNLGQATAAGATDIQPEVVLTQSLQDVANAQVVIEAIADDLEAKHELLCRLEEFCTPETIFASTTCSIPINKLGSFLCNPERLLGLSFSRPASATKLVEVVRGQATHRDAARRMGYLVSNWGKYCVQSRSTPGFIVNRVASPFFSEALSLLQEQVVSPATLDAIMCQSGGFKMGPLQLMDLIGHDIHYAATLSMFNASYQDPRFKPSLMQKELVDAGRLGRDSGRGFFDYSANPCPPHPEQFAPQAPPDQVVIGGELGIASSLQALFSGAGIPVEQGGGGAHIVADGVRIALTDGRTATERSTLESPGGMVLFDLAFDYTTSERIAIAAADQCGQESLRCAAGLFQAIGKSVSVIDDAPGMVLMRTVCRLANEGADAVNQDVCEVKAVDLAMRHGAGYPMGPLVWADRIGLGHVCTTLDNIHRYYAEDRYRVSPLLRRKSLSGLDFYSQATLINRGEGTPGN